jgi:benzoate-CoA ligase
MRIGAVPVPANPLLPGRDLAVIVADSRARVLVVSSERAEVTGDICSGAPEVAHVVSTDAWESLTGAGGDGGAHDTWAESPGFWLCTSGTTGLPKLAMHRHGDLRVTVETYAANVLGISPSDRCYSVGPMFHAYGLGNSLTFPFAVGATTILEPTRPPTPALVAGIVRAEEPTLFFCIPTFYAALNAADLPADTFASVRYGISAAEPLPAETFTRFRDRYGVTILDGIGSTEMLHIFLSNAPGAVRPGTSGMPVPGYDVRIIDEAGADQPAGEPGELVVRGESAAVGYWCRSERSRATFEGAWTHTGDLYVRDDSGFHTYLGRTDDMLRVAGEWVSPAEVEAVLMEHADVLEAAVVGERDDAGVLRPIAYVIPQAGAEPAPDDLVAFCRDRLAGYKRPRRVVLVSDLPKTATGKIQRYKLRA